MVNVKGLEDSPVQMDNECDLDFSGANLMLPIAQAIFDRLVLVLRTPWHEFKSTKAVFHLSFSGGVSEQRQLLTLESSGTTLGTLVRICVIAAFAFELHSSILRT
jgi:hypothetical protein